MRIMMVAARYLPYMGGIETHIHEVGTRMAAAGHYVEVLTTDPSGSLPMCETKEGLRIRRVKAYPKNRDFFFAPDVYRYIAAIDGGKACDILHFQGYNTFVPPLGMRAAIRHHIPFVLTFHSGGHSSRLRNSIRGVQQSMLAPMVRQAERLIGVSQFEADSFAKKMDIATTRFEVAPNGAALPPPSDPPPAVDPHLILSVGRLEYYKGHHRAIMAHPYVRERVPDARLMIVGSGPYEAQLRKLVAKLHLQDCVSFISIPSSERQRLTDLLCSAGLVVLLSDYEAHPVSVMEAVSVRKPVLVTDTSGLRELAEKGLCQSMPLNSTTEEIASRIAIQLTEQKWQPPEVVLPNWDDCAHRLIGIYAAVLNKDTLMRKWAYAK